jgi:hypothetical protein
MNLREDIRPNLYEGDWTFPAPRLRSGRVVFSKETVRRFGIERWQSRIEAKTRPAVGTEDRGTEDRVRPAHIDVDVRVVLRWGHADALAQLAQHSMWPTSRPAGGPSGVGRVMGKPLRHRPSVCTGILVEPCPDLAEPTAQPSGRDANSNPDRKAPFRLGDRSTETALARRDLPRKSGQIPLLGTKAKPSTVLLLKRVRGMYKYFISLSLLMSTPVLATEPAYIGVWASDSEGCKYPREVLQITKKEITGNEWMCRIKNISSDGAGWLASLACAGEGSEYTLTSHWEIATNGHFRETLKTSKPPAVCKGQAGRSTEWCAALLN